MTLEGQVQERTTFLIGQIKHASNKRAKVRLERHKNEVRSLVAKYGMPMMFPTFERFGYKV